MMWTYNSRTKIWNDDFETQNICIAIIRSLKKKQIVWKISQKNPKDRKDTKYPEDQRIKWHNGHKNLEKPKDLKDRDTQRTSRPLRPNRISFRHFWGSHLVKFLGSRLENFGGYSFGNFLGLIWEFLLRGVRERVEGWGFA